VTRAFIGIGLLAMAIPIVIFLVATGDAVEGPDSFVALTLIAIAGGAVVGGVYLLRRSRR
jgi:hypothetical protein